MTAAAWRPLPQPDGGAGKQAVAVPGTLDRPIPRHRGDPGTVLPLPPGRVQAAAPGAAGQVLPPGATGQVLPLVAVLFTALVAQVALSPRLASADLLLLSTAAVAASFGRETGAAYGFAAGLAADLFVATPFGLSALAFTAVGHLLGGASGDRGPGRARRAARLGALACLGGGLFVVSAGALFAGGGPVPPVPVALRLLAGSAVSAALAPPLFAVVSRLPALASR